MEAATFDLNLVRQADYYLAIYLQDSNGDAVNITGYTFDAEIVGDEDIIPDITYDLSVTIISASTGVIKIAIDKTEITTFSTTSAMPKSKRPKWDLLYTNGVDFTQKILKGIVNIEETQTTP